MAIQKEGTMPKRFCIFVNWFNGICAPVCGLWMMLSALCNLPLSWNDLMPLSIYDPFPFHDIFFTSHFWPGLALLLVNGVPNIVAIIARHRCSSGSWVAWSIIAGTLLIVWTTIELLLIPNGVTVFYFALGLLQLTAALAVRHGMKLVGSLSYTTPTLKDQQAIAAFLDEYFEASEMDAIYGQDLLMDDFPAWVRMIENNAAVGNGEWGKSLLYLCWSKSRLVGVLVIRYELTTELADKYGHIGYTVRPTERNKGYATLMLKYALDVCRKLGLQSATLGCYKHNAPSVEVIKKCGGVLIAENDNYTPGISSQYYTIFLQG